MDQAVTYCPQLPSRDYQLAACAAMRGRHAFALLMAMRTGKSKVLLDDFGALELAGEARDLLIIAPAGVYRTWEDEIRKQVSRDLLERLRVHTWQSGHGARAGEALAAFLADRSGPRVFLVNVEALSLASTGAREACEQFLRERAQAMVAIDESTVVKNPKALRTRYILMVIAPLARWRRILSGLPTPRSPLDLWAQFQFLDPRILRQPNYYTFMLRYAIVRQTNFGGRLRRAANIVVGYRDEAALRKLVAPHSYRVEFRPDIPSTYSVRHVELTAEQRRIYDQLKTQATAEISAAGEHVTATLVITRMLRLHQVLCGHVVDEEGRGHEIRENRTQALLDLLDDYAGKAIIWCSYDHDVRKVAGALAREYETVDRVTGQKVPAKVARFWGGNATTREDEEKMFKADPECRFMVATPSAGGRGRTWDVADLVVYYSSTNNLEHRDQSEQRAQNVGKARQVDYVDLIVPGTVDATIIRALRDKIDMAATITGDNYREWLV